jgi:heme-degrading monooxygenase HmoA
VSILERAELPVIAGREAEFERAFAAVRHLPTRIEGFRSLRLVRGIESPSLYVLLIEWDSVEAHEQGFRRSGEYEQWRAALHHFYDPFPVVEHFTTVD